MHLSTAYIVNVQGGNELKSTAPAFSNIPLVRSAWRIAELWRPSNLTLFYKLFHTDNCEIMAFFYLDVALQGGQTMLSSIWQTYNELAAKRPEVSHTLAEPWVLDT